VGYLPNPSLTNPLITNIKRPYGSSKASCSEDSQEKGYLESQEECRSPSTKSSACQQYVAHFHLCLQNQHADNLQIGVKPSDTLATELKRMIFGYLQDDPVTSVCLGLTCKSFYNVLKEFHPEKVTLKETIRFGAGGIFQATLKLMLSIWMGPNMHWDYTHSKFVSKETMEGVLNSFDDGCARAQAPYAEKIERDLYRIKSRKRDRRRYGCYIDEDLWSNFSVMESVGTSQYEPTEGTCDGGGQHDREFWLGTLEELELELELNNSVSICELPFAPISLICISPESFFIALRHLRTFADLSYLAQRLWWHVF
jgi:hypothetical protein